MSRHPTKASTSAQEKITEEDMTFLITHAVPKAMTLEEIITASTDDRDSGVVAGGAGGHVPQRREKMGAPAF